MTWGRILFPAAVMGFCFTFIAIFDLVLQILIASSEDEDDGED